MIKLFFLYLFSSLFIHANNENEIQSLSKSPEWRKLLYYDQGLFGIKSEIASEDFFVKSKNDPFKELTSFLDLLKEDPRIRCRFPARTKLVVKKLNLSSRYTNFSHCEEYLDFSKFMKPEKAYLVFSSYFLESPGSAFGHTFLRFSKKQHISGKQKDELLDLGINYGAAVTTDNPILYSLFGIIGGFDGVYSSMPYYRKVREYNNFESRDLWSYELKLSSLEKEKLVDHLWEIAKTKSPYYFFTKNCSYRVLKALEAVRPSLDILDDLPFFVIPADTIKVLAKKDNLVERIYFRPSVKRTFEWSYDQLSENERKIFTKFIETKKLSDVEEYKLQTQANVLDVALEYLDFKYSKEMLASKGEFYTLKNKILRKRAKLPSMKINTDVATPEEEKPHLGHSSQRLGVKYGYNKELKNYEELELRMALHDLLDPLVGQPKLAEITFFSLSGRYYNQRKSLQLERWTLAQVSTLNPIGFKHIPLSLSARVGVERVRNSACSNCLAPLLNFGSGLTKGFLSNKLLFSAFLDNDLSYDDSYIKKSFRYSVGPKAQVVSRWNNKVSQILSGSWKAHLLQEEDDWQINHALRFHLSKIFSLEVKNRLIDNYQEHQLSLFTFF